MENIYLIEDHDDALKVWRQKRIKGLDLVHLDAHIDFGYYFVRPVEKVISQAKSLKELKKELERSIAFMQYEKDFHKQAHIGNYVYPAMEEDIVKSFYWVVPGDSEIFRKSYKFIKKIFKTLLKNTDKKTLYRKDGVISTDILGRKLIVCTLEKLPVLKQDILLDIDTDFLVIDSLKDADNTVKIGKRRPWILPQDLVRLLKEKIKNTPVITIAYSVNGGWTPIKYKQLTDEIAYCFFPKKFEKRFKRSSQASKYFNLFISTGKKEYYRKAVKLNPAYRVEDNNYGPIYLSLGKLSLAEKQFLKILKADPQNPGSLLGMGNIALERGDFKKAKKYFSSVLKSADKILFSKVKTRGLLGLAKAEFKLRNFAEVKKLLHRYQNLESLEPESYYLLGRVSEKEKDFKSAVSYYKDALRLGIGDIEAVWRLLRLSRLIIEDRKKIIKYATASYARFKKMLANKKKMALKEGRKIKGLNKIEKRMADIDKMLQKKL